MIDTRFLKKLTDFLCAVLLMGIRFRDCRGLQFLLTTQMEELHKFQKLVREAVKKLEKPPSREVIESATVCHLRPARLPLNW
jgi:E3 ubiquitin-protein ligase SHPRH